jgi:hypothetical protein
MEVPSKMEIVAFQDLTTDLILFYQGAGEIASNSQCATCAARVCSCAGFSNEQGPRLFELFDLLIHNPFPNP